MASGRDFDGTNDDDKRAFEQFLRQFGLTPGADGSFDMNALAQQLQQAMSQLSSQMAAFGSGADGQGLNWNFTRDIARKVTAAQGPDPSPERSDSQRISDAVALAELWLDNQTTFGRVNAPARAWSRAEWIEGTFATWQKLTAPVASSFATAISTMLAQQGNDAGAMGALGGAMEPMMKAAASGMLAAQVGQALGEMATEVLSACDIALPLTAKPVTALLPANVAHFGDGLEQPAADVLHYLALRESARQRLFESVGWLAPQLIALIEHYARGITIDSDAIQQAMESQLGGDMTPDAMEKLGETLTGKLFEPVRTPEQDEILARLETLVALIEGWVDDVVSVTAAGMLPGAPALLETVRRRRAAGGASEQALKHLLNLELRPRRVREAANLWAALRTAKGIDGRDATWAHPDAMPTPTDLEDPLGFVERGPASPAATASEFGDLDAELARLLEEEGRERGDEG